MAEIEFASSNEQLKSLVKREFPNYIPIPSLAESSAFDILHFSSANLANEPEEKSWTETFMKTFSWSQADSGCLANFVSLGCFFDHCKKDPKDRVKAREVPVCIHEQASGSQEMSADVKGEVLSLAGIGGSASSENIKYLGLGKIVKSSMSYHQIKYWLKRITPENSPLLFREAKKKHLYIIYEVLLAERLMIEKHESVDNGGYASATANNGIYAKGSGKVKRTKSYRLSRPKSMGRYPIAFKCGRVRVKKTKRHLGLVGLKEFNEPYQFRRQINESPSQSQSPPEHEDNSL